MLRRASDLGETWAPVRVRASACTSWTMFRNLEILLVRTMDPGLRLGVLENRTPEKTRPNSRDGRCTVRIHWCAVPDREFSRKGSGSSDTREPGGAPACNCVRDPEGARRTC